MLVGALGATRLNGDLVTYISDSCSFLLRKTATASHGVGHGECVFRACTCTVRGCRYCTSDLRRIYIRTALGSERLVSFGRFVGQCSRVTCPLFL